MLGRVLRALRKEAGLTQEALGFRAGLHATYVSDIERGARNPSFEVMARLFLALGVTWERFGIEIDRESSVAE
jgi:transcriptional regulator with XRE-family HTH domain